MQHQILTTQPVALSQYCDKMSASVWNFDRKEIMNASCRSDM